MQFVATLIAGLVLIVAESVGVRILGLSVLVPQLTVGLIVYLGLRRPFDQGAGLTLILAAVADLSSGGPRGYYALGLTAVFLLSASLAGSWKHRGLLLLLGWTAGGVIVSDFVCLGGAAIFRGATEHLLARLAMSPVSALWTTLVAIPFLWGADRLDALSLRRDRRATDFS